MMLGFIGVLEQSTLSGIRYCPLNATNYYNIDYTIVPSNTNSNYCPLDVSSYYDFAQAP